MKSNQPCRVFVAVEPSAFARLVEHVLHTHAGFRVLGRSRRSDSLLARARHLAPDVIVANTRLDPREPRGASAQRLADLKRSSPASLLIRLTHDLDEIPASSREAENARLPEGAVVRRLVTVIRQLVARDGARPPRLRPTGRRRQEKP